MAMIEMTVEGIGIDPQNNPLVLLRDETRSTFVPIWIGLSEAVAIQTELDQRAAQRPMTHDLIANILSELKVRLVKVTVNEFEESIYYASLHLQIGEGESPIQELDARPSDAIALALRARCGIFVSETVSKKAGIQVEDAGPDALRRKLTAPEREEISDAPPDEAEKLARLLEGVDLGEPDKN
jgi:bifunctional DNase/RNase